MSILPAHTTQLHAWIDRLRTGDRGARDDLLRGITGRLYPLAQKMLGRFPNVRRWADTDDVLQNAQLRLLRAWKPSARTRRGASSGWPPSRFAAS